MLGAGPAGTTAEICAAGAAGAARGGTVDVDTPGDGGDTAVIAGLGEVPVVDVKAAPVIAGAAAAGASAAPQCTQKRVPS